MRIITVLLLLVAMLLAIPRPSSAGITIAYDFGDHFRDAKVADALSAKPGQWTSGGIKKRGFSLHPTQKNAIARYEVTLPSIAPGERLILTFSAGLNDGLKTDDPKNPFDGVRSSVKIEGKQIFSADLSETRWVDGAADLTSFAEKQIEVVFITDSKGNSNYDWASWGEPQVIRLPKNAISGNPLATTKGLVLVQTLDGKASVRVAPSGETDGVSAQVQPNSVAVLRFDFTKTKATTSKLTASGPASVEVFEYDPQLEIESFGPSSALLLTGTPIELRCVIKNVGEGELKASSAVRATLSGAFTAGKSATPSVATLGAFKPGESRTICWTGRSVPAKPSASVAIAGQGIAKLTREWRGAAAKSPVAMPAKVAKAEAVKLSDGTLVLQCPTLRLAFPMSADGYVGWMASIAKGDAWQTIATGPLGDLVLADKAGGRETHPLHAKTAKVSNAPDKSPGVSLALDKAIHGGNCHFERQYTIDAGRVHVAHSMKSDVSLPVLHFAGPTVCAGDRGFGKTRDEALFPGLEYLLTEASSGTANASPPFNVRTVPHPNKITIPFMAVRKGGTLISLEWDPLQKWDGSADRPAAVFASPNFVDGQDNHLVGLFAPSVPDWTPENETVAAKHYTLDPGKTLTLEADLVVKTGSKTILDAVDGWIAKHGVPDPPKPKTDELGWMDMWNTAFHTSTYDDTAKGWKHTNTHPAAFDPMIVACLANLANLDLDPISREKTMNLVRGVLEPAWGRIPPEVALLVGGVPDALKRMGESVSQIIARQKPDGSWPFEPDEKHSVLGMKGDTSSGHTANSAVTVLRYALMTCDPKATASGLKALKYLDTQTRPEGSQTWELQLHVPDILASGRLVDAYLSGYLLTNDKRYLDRAAYWAKSGLPFVYLWNAQDRPIMRYGTIPVFGATWFDGQPWFGNCVQWCGLDYAYWVSRLGDYDKSFPWNKIADGIMKCGIQMEEYTTEKYPADKGMYPDAFSAVTGEETYHWDLNPMLQFRLVFQTTGSDAFPRTATTTDQFGHRLSFTAPASRVSLVRDGEFLKATCVGAKGRTIYAILSGVRAPLIGLPSRNIAGVADITKWREGAQYFEDKAMTIIKYEAGGSDTFTIDLLMHNRERALEAENAKRKSADAQPKPAQ